MTAAQRLQLHEDPDLYKKVFQLSPEAIVIIDRTGHIIEMNDRMTEWLGYPKKDVLHKHLLQLPFLTLKNKQLLIKNFLTRISGKERSEYQAEFLTKDGHVRIGKIKGALIRDASGHVVADLAMITEATQELREETAIRKKEEILEAVNYSARTFLKSQANQADYEKVLKSIGESASASRVVLVINDLLGQRYEWAAPGIASIVLDKKYPNLFQKANELSEFSKKLEDNNIIFGIESDFDKDVQAVLKRYKIKSFVLQPIFVNKKWWAYLCIHDCLEERKWLSEEIDALVVASKIIGAAMEKNLVELKLRETVEYWRHEKERVTEEIANTQKFKQAVDSATDGVVITTVDRKIIYINRALENMTEYSSAEAVGKNSDFLTIAKTPHQILTKLWETLDAGQPFNSDEVVMSKKDGTELPVRLSVFAINEKGKPQFFVGILEDITRRREIDRMKTEFISIVSHQLNTPLSAMKWFLELLQMGKAGPLLPKQQEFVQNLIDSNIRMIALVRSLLNISRIESGRIIIDPHLTDIRVLIDDVLKEVAPFFEKKSQKINVNIDENLSKVMLDPRLIRNVYLNLLTNSSKYSPEGTEVDINIFQKDDELVSHVIDHGYGIPKNDQDKIFTKFFRAANVVRLEADGSGLGMYLVKIVVESSGGEITLNSEENKGTDVGFVLPLKGVKPKSGDVFLDQNAYS
ncbi:MAG: PAS domain S-box protein [Patescibacteria group bacterium]